MIQDMGPRLFQKLYSKKKAHIKYSIATEAIDEIARF
jgi:hypothetical protein